MAQLSNMSPATASAATVEKKTNYSEKRFDGVKYQTVELAVQAGAKTYAVSDLNKSQELLEELGIEVPDTVLIQALYNIKKRQIMAIVDKHESREQAVLELAL